MELAQLKKGISNGMFVKFGNKKVNLISQNGMFDVAVSPRHQGNQQFEWFKDGERQNVDVYGFVDGDSEPKLFSLKDSGLTLEHPGIASLEHSIKCTKLNSEFYQAELNNDEIVLDEKYKSSAIEKIESNNESLVHLNKQLDELKSLSNA